MHRLDGLDRVQVRIHFPLQHLAQWRGFLAAQGEDDDAPGVAEHGEGEREPVGASSVRNRCTLAGGMGTFESSRSVASLKLLSS